MTDSEKIETLRHVIRQIMDYIHMKIDDPSLHSSSCEIGGPYYDEKPCTCGISDILNGYC